VAFLPKVNIWRLWLLFPPARSPESHLKSLFALPGPRLCSGNGNGKPDAHSAPDFLANLSYKL